MSVSSGLINEEMSVSSGLINGELSVSSGLINEEMSVSNGLMTISVVRKEQRVLEERLRVLRGDEAGLVKEREMEEQLQHTADEVSRV